MKLRYSPTSPYVRKVTAAALECGLDDRIERIMTDTADPALARDNPLGKVPALVADDGTALCESPVICDYLDSLHDGEKLHPPAGPERWRALNLAALADGVMDAAILRIQELRLRPVDKRSAKVMALQQDKIARTLDQLEPQAADGALDAAFTIGELSLACALGYLDFRFAEDAWRDGRPELARWYEEIAKRPSLKATTPHDP